jgi:hypothetical protein
MTQISLDTLKTNIKSILDAANTTTGSPIDLSSGLNTRVSRVLKVHPARIPIQPSFFPYIASYVSKINVEQVTMGNRGSQASALRMALVEIAIVGVCYEPFFTDINEDQGEENVERLMQNVEEILRSNPSLNHTSTTWVIPKNHEFIDTEYTESAHLRAGIFTIQAKVHY